MNYYFVDTHAHLYNEYYEDVESVVDNSLVNNINYIINNGCDQKTNEEVLKTLSNPHIYGAIGIHPENVLNYKKEDLDFIEKNLHNEKVIAIGEIGLDYYYDKSTKDKQIELFEQQLKLAEKYNMPVIVHSREATQDTIDILKKYKVKGTIHSFSGSLEVAKIYINMGFILGINGVLTFKNSNVKDVIKELPLDSIILETDAPYLTPHPYRGQRNEPKYILNIAEFISELKNISLEDLSTITNDNIKKTYPKIKI